MSFNVDSHGFKADPYCLRQVITSLKCLLKIEMEISSATAGSFLPQPFQLRVLQIIHKEMKTKLVRMENLKNIYTVPVITESEKRESINKSIDHKLHN